jgi:hypothetical protein
LKSRAYCLASVRLAVAAIYVHVLSLGEASKGMKLYARAVVATESQKESLKVEAKPYANRSGTIALSGLCLAIGSVVCLIVSFKKREPAWRSISCALLVFYVLLQLAIV